VKESEHGAQLSDNQFATNSGTTWRRRSENEITTTSLSIVAFGHEPMLGAIAQGHTLLVDLTDTKVTYTLDGVNAPAGKLLGLATDMFSKDPMFKGVGPSY
jgi:hypothetical protein